MPARYKLYPDEYMYNTETRRHTLRTGDAFKKKFRENPALFIESRSVLPAEPIEPPVQLPLPPASPVELKIPHIGAKLPKPEPPPAEDVQDLALRQKVKELIQAELKQNPREYENKSADEMSRAFRAMLIERLAPPSAPAKSGRPTPINHTTKLASRPPQKSKWVMRKPPSEDELDDEEEYDEAEDDGELF